MILTDALLDDVLRAAAFIGMYFVLFLLAKWLKAIVAPYKIDEELTHHDNPAIALAMSGYFLATAAIFVGALSGPTLGFRGDLAAVGGYSLLGLVMLNLSRWFNDTIIVRKFCNTQQLIKERNIGVGAVQFGIYLATGLIATGAISGQGGNALTAIVFFVLGQFSLLVFSIIYDKLSIYHVQDELHRNNAASGVAFGGTLIALAIIIMNGASGDFVDWKKDLIQFAVANVIAFVFLPIMRLVMDRLVVSGASLGREIRDDRNIGAGLLEATIAISFAVIITRLI